MSGRVFLFLLLAFSNFSFACKCLELPKNKIVETGLKQSDMVFYGEVVKSDAIAMTYSFKILEVFKGNPSSTILNGTVTTNCDLFPEKGVWIVYAKLNTDNSISMDMCLPSQSLDFGPGYPTPPFIKGKDGKIREMTIEERHLVQLKEKNKTLESWIYQFDKLRQYKLAQNTMAEASKTEFKNKIIIGSLIANALLLLTIIGIIVSKKT